MNRNKTRQIRGASALFALGLIMGITPSWAAVKVEKVSYLQGETRLEGVLAYDDTNKAERPGVLVVHEWWGLNDYARSRAEQLASLGYIALAVDMYGGGKNTQHPQTAGEWAGEVAKNRDVGRARFQAGYDLLAKHPLTSKGKIAAIGYCFGGNVVLSMAGAGLDLAAVASFHGSLPQEAPTAGAVKAKVLVAHGAADGFISPEQIATFQKNFTAAGADWQFVSYGGAQHSFSNPNAGAAGVPGLAYDAAADRRSWAAMQELFAEVFGRR